MTAELLGDLARHGSIVTEVPGSVGGTLAGRAIAKVIEVGRGARFESGGALLPGDERCFVERPPCVGGMVAEGLQQAVTAEAVKFGFVDAFAELRESKIHE